jgi:hypothetical protein
MKKYDSAYYYQKFREIDDPYERSKWNETLAILSASQLKNKLAATYLQASSDSVAFSTSLASLSYSHIYDEKNTFGANVNYAARRSGVGVQGGLNYSRIFTPTLYADIGFLIGTKFFPDLIIYGNAYKGLKNGYEVQAGIRLTRFSAQRGITTQGIPIFNDVNLYSLNLGASKTWEDIWLTTRVSLMRDDAFTYINVMAQTKINVNPRKDQVSIMVAGGSAPFDNQLPEGQAAFLNFSNILIGAGYLYNISSKTAVLVDGTWINFQSNTTDNGEFVFVNQYNLSFSIITKF